ncbi:potassium channel family protein [Streptomyces sp. NPDC001549]|uniref:potassium channel family protein n=1 Tax=Streptomyces sp. NPDC001549 TaxID=3364586 RepID=UPI003685F574
MLRAPLRPVLTAAGLVADYCTLPLDEALHHRNGGRAGHRSARSVRPRRLADTFDHPFPYPRLKAIEALATIFPLFISLFTASYFLMEGSQPGFFSESLSRTDALYFTVTVLSTVGFGDITAKTGVSRCVVMVQMLGGMVLVGAAVRVILGAVSAGLGRRAQSASPKPRPVRLRRRTRRTNHRAWPLTRLNEGRSTTSDRR